MSCFICGRGNCTPCFHSLKEQQAFDRAEDAYRKFLEVRDECKNEWEDREVEEEDEI